MSAFVESMSRSLASAAQADVRTAVFNAIAADPEAGLLNMFAIFVDLQKRPSVVKAMQDCLLGYAVEQKMPQQTARQLTQAAREYAIGAWSELVMSGPDSDSALDALTDCMTQILKTEFPVGVRPLLVKRLQFIEQSPGATQRLLVPWPTRDVPTDQLAAYIKQNAYLSR